MGLEKAIQHKKEYRKEYRGAKSVDPTCRNHGSCPWCIKNRKYKYVKDSQKVQQEMKEYEQDN